jgi:type II secretory pathway component PulK
MQQTQLSKLMHLSWEVQKRRKSSRSKSLLAAWAIFLNEDITVYWLVQKHSTTRRDKVPTANLTLFN